MSARIESQDETEGSEKGRCNVHGQDGNLELGDAIEVDGFAGRGGHETDFGHGGNRRLFLGGGLLGPGDVVPALVESSRSSLTSRRLGREGGGWSELNSRAAYPSSTTKLGKGTGSALADCDLGDGY